LECLEKYSRYYFPERHEQDPIRDKKIREFPPFLKNSKFVTFLSRLQKEGREAG
jgi:hypothetical protein